MHVAIATILSSLALPFSLAASPYTISNSTNATITPPDRYYLKTQVVGSDNPNKTDLYVAAYHTGAGFNDVTLESIDVAAVGFLNETYQQFNLSALSTEYISWSFFMESDTNYAGWEFVEINIGYITPGFYFTETGLQWNNTGEFSGWLACDWYHGVPQLFWLVNPLYHPHPRPSSCSVVNLLPVAV